MSNTVLVGMFDTAAAAAEAKTRLLAAGFSQSAVSLTGGDTSMATTGVSDGAGAAPVHEGGIAHFFRNLFGNDDDAVRSSEGTTYQEAFRRGGHAVTVTAAGEAEIDRAEAILNDAGAVDIDEKAAKWTSEGWSGAASSVGGAMAAGASALHTGATQTLKEVEETLAVGKRAVQRGGVRVFSRMTEVPVEETVRLREEHADVQRRVVDRPATEADFAAFKEGSIELRESAEEAVVSKTARVVGEVEVGTRVTEHDHTVRETVRRTEVDVEPIDAGTGRTSAYAGGTTTGTAMGTTTAIGTGTTGLGGTGHLHGATDAESANRDPLSGEPGSHPVGTAVGASAGGMAAGAAVGTVAGPIGTVVGAAVGAVAGGLAGKGVAEKIDPTVPPRA